MRGARPHYRPEEAYIGDRLSALGAGVTTLLDWSHIRNSPAHTDAAIEGLREVGVRAVYAYGSGTAGPDNAYPGDIRRLRREHFNSGDQLLTLALAAGLDTRDWAVAREVEAPITSHVNSFGSLPPLADRMGPDNTYILCTQLTVEEFDLIADTGGGVFIAGPVEMEGSLNTMAAEDGLNEVVPGKVFYSAGGSFWIRSRSPCCGRVWFRFLFWRMTAAARPLPPYVNLTAGA